MNFEPFAKQRRNLVGQAQRYPPDARHAQSGEALDSLLHELISDCGYDRRDRAMSGHAKLHQTAQSGKTLDRRGAAWLKLGGQRGVEGRHRNRHRHQILARHGFEQIGIVQHAVGLGGDRHRMARFEAHFEYLAGDAVIALNRLIWIGVGAQRNRARLILGFVQRGAQQFGGVWLGEQFGLEIEAGREVVIGMGGPRIAIDATIAYIRYLVFIVDRNSDNSYAKIEIIVRSIREGRDNDPDFFTRMQPKGVWADLLRSRFRIACKRAGIGKHRFELDCTRFRPPEVGGQMRLL